MRRLGLLTAFAVLAAACGVPVDSAPSALPDDSLPPGLSSTTTTTIPEAEPDGANVDIFLIGEDGKLEPVERPVPQPVPIQTVIELLIAAGDDEELVEQKQLRSAIPTRTTVLGVENNDGTLIVNLGPEGLVELDEGEQQLQALAQLVYTATDLGSVDGVLLQIEGELRPIPTQGERTEGDRPVTREDFDSLA